VEAVPPLLVTVPHSGTRWMAQNFISSKVPLNYGHFYLEGGKAPMFESEADYFVSHAFTLIRPMPDIVESYLKRGHPKDFIVDRVTRYAQAQKRFIDQGGQAFELSDNVLNEIGEWLGVELIDSGLRHSYKVAARCKKF
jgi:hypothetical protein